MRKRTESGSPQPPRGPNDSETFGPSKRLAAGIASGALVGALAVGGIGFLSGFLGPIVLAPEANQGPLLGIFITGPGGAVLGAVLGGALGMLGVSWRTLRIALAIACSLMAVTTLYFSTAEPQYRASILDAEIRGCDPPVSRRAKALEYWDAYIARVTWSAPRPGWKEDLDRLLAEEKGVVLTFRTQRQFSVYENRKPWNRGTLVARPRRPDDRDEGYFATYSGGSCASYPAGTRATFLATGASAQQWPPEILANLLALQTVEPIPERYERLIRE